jgi:protein SCO1/2
MNSRRPLLWLIAAALLAAAGGAALSRMLAQKQPRLHSGTWLPQRQLLSPFTLSDLHGKRFDNAALVGHSSLLFFGFTSCPDVCPTTLAALAPLLRQPPLPDLQVLFVSVDPGRDRPEVLRPYLASFDARIVGLTGNEAALAPLLHSLGAIAERIALPDGSYTMDHSATLYLLDPQGHMAAVFSPPFTSASLRADLEQLAQRRVL